MKHLRKRTLLMVLLLLTGGAIINVAVAWGCALYSHDLGTTQRIVYRQRTAQEDIQNQNSVSCFEFVPASSLEVWSGVPINCFQGHFSESLPDTNDPGWRWIGSGGVVVETPSRTKFVPLTPLWPGFAINTIFYAAILWLLFAAPGFVRRRIRTRRGQCPACAYPVGASDVCTECGRPVIAAKMPAHDPDAISLLSLPATVGRALISMGRTRK